MYPAPLHTTDWSHWVVWADLCEQHGLIRRARIARRIANGLKVRRGLALREAWDRAYHDAYWQDVYNYARGVRNDSQRLPYKPLAKRWVLPNTPNRKHTVFVDVGCLLATRDPMCRGPIGSNLSPLLTWMFFLMIARTAHIPVQPLKLATTEAPKKHKRTKRTKKRRRQNFQAFDVAPLATIGQLCFSCSHEILAGERIYVYRLSGRVAHQDCRLLRASTSSLTEEDIRNEQRDRAYREHVDEGLGRTHGRVTPKSDFEELDILEIYDEYDF